ncbi:MAG: Mrp/NBP35 family ATP-binding protein, partial [Candidatus Altiarchaeota archaeon]|nr:Mrp/NBP35 family ATP-binding protein [Candidatus Altiarchaeota archaeon]
RNCWIAPILRGPRHTTGASFSSMKAMDITYSLGTRGIKVMSMAFMLEKDAPVVWRGPLKMGAIQQFLAEVEWGNLDYLIIDLPPGTGDEPLSIAQLISDITGSVIVTTPQEVALMDSRRSVNFSKMLNVPVLGIIENMSGMKCPHCDKDVNIFGSGGGEKAARELGVNFLGRIPIDPRIVENSDSGTPFMIKNPKSESTRSFKDIVDKIKGGK